MTQCPNCKADITTLRAVLSQTHTVRLVKDWTETEKSEFHKGKKWPNLDGKALGYVRRKDVPTAYAYYCPKCAALLFVTPENAFAFLMPGKRGSDQC
jgi:hypothetical protein